jgi:hypothetical protein
MADPLPRSPAAPSAATGSEGDWPAQVTGQLVRVVDRIKQNTTTRATTAVRAVVYGIIAAWLGIAIAVLAFIGLFRLVDRIRNLVIEDSVWLTYFIVGALFVVVGAIVFATRKPRT